MHIRVLFFGLLKEITGRTEELLELPADATLQTVYTHYARQAPQLDSLRASILFAKNQEFAPGTAALAEGDEVAFLPPVSGGRGPYTHVIDEPDGHFFALTRERIDVPALQSLVLRDEDGAVVQFEGVVRNNTKGRPTLYLDYECYEGMAVKLMAQIGREIVAAHAIGRIALVHRLGRLEIGEASVAVVVSAPHRGTAFAAALEGINRLKKLVPIWKKEHFADGEVWVDGEWDESVRQPS